MHPIDHYAYSNRFRFVDPAQKAGLALLVILLCLVLDRPAVGLLAAGWMWGLASRAGLPAVVFTRLLLAEGLFLLLAVSGVALSLSLTPPEGSFWLWKVGPWWLGSSQASIETAARLATRALGSVAAMNFLALTTPVVDLVDLLRRLRVPVPLIDLMTLVYRFLFTLFECLSRMHTAQDSRLGYINLRRGMVSAGVLVTRLFVEAYHRSCRLQIALESRGSSGALRVLPSHYRNDRRLYWFGMGIVASLFLARVVV